MLCRQGAAYREHPTTRYHEDPNTRLSQPVASGPHADRLFLWRLDERLESRRHLEPPLEVVGRPDPLCALSLIA